ncbi:YceI family protein [Pseudogracilibacillus auburnensis]|uniref:Polyisoprenoid-binding protein YceI n=1 Tax=Pseudogracilibacillus auburnensis TaxID=1494959 RepID=A0A2V3VV78_9BACI|nr:YceI family protein [Pseudogracilibacillus auburnensis]MBO1003840.1 YceI family protein [Pseudogracilibacillus auburnensis]PXW84761.1 polyisoprenoid-binding protein YceI [Pseudogracilibacillus auburnensis]
MATWNVDASHTNVGFSVKHMMVSKVRGRFTEVEGTIEGNPEDLTNAQINFKIHVSSIHTNSDDRDNHLRSADFFDVEKYPYITFSSTEIVKTGNNEYKITGDMTMKDVTKKATFEAEYVGSGKNPWGVDLAAFEVEGKVSRKEFGLTWNQTLETGGVLVGDDIKITLELQANPA